MENFELKAKIYLILKIIVLFGALNWGLIAINKNYNLVEIMTLIFPHSYQNLIQRIIYIIIFLSAVYVMIQRKTYLPFLDISIVPINRFLSESKQKDFELEIVINAKGGSKVIYWASNKKISKDEKLSDHEEAYGKFENSGISIVDNEGKAKLYVKCPQKYFVMHNKILPQHVHYRVVTDGKLGEIKTVNLNC
jgi:uncharacterized membrane protein YuzA (DUF378 family)